MLAEKKMIADNLDSKYQVHISINMCVRVFRLRALSFSLFVCVCVSVCVLSLFFSLALSLYFCLCARARVLIAYVRFDNASLRVLICVHFVQSLLEKQRQYFKAVKDFQEECDKNELLMAKFEEAKRKHQQQQQAQ